MYIICMHVYTWTNKNPDDTNGNEWTSRFGRHLKICNFTCTAADPRRIHGRSAEDPCRRHEVRNSGLGEWPIQVVELHGSLKVIFYLHRGRSAEDLRKIPRRPPRKICVQDLMANRITNSTYGVWNRAEDLIWPASRKICERPAEDLRRISAEGISLGPHGEENHQFSLRSFEEGWKSAFSCTAEDPQMIRGRPLLKISVHFSSEPTRQPGRQPASDTQPHRPKCP